MRPLTTDRCILRRLSRDDAGHVWSAAQTPGFTDGMTWEPPQNFEDMHTFTDEAIRLWETGEKYIWTIESKDGGSFIGRIEAKKATELPGNVWGIGYWIHPLEQKKGYATEAGKEVVRFVFEELGGEAVVSSHADWNAASGKVLSKIGMTHTGFSDGRTMKNGKPVRAAEFWLDREEWQKACASRFPIRTDRLILRAVEPKDLDAIWEAAQSPGLADGMYWEPPDSKELVWEQMQRENIGGNWYPLVITDLNGIFLGRFFLQAFSGPWEIGYWLLPRYRGKGYALEAATAMAGFAFRSLKAEKVIASSCPWNESSTALLLKLGMHKVGVREKGLKKGGVEYATEDFEITSADFSPSS